MNRTDFWLSNLPIAHRGLHDDMLPENSLSAFYAAMKAGYGIELDVQLSKDGAVVVFHDFNALRMTGKDALISELTLSEIMTLRLLSPLKKPSCVDGSTSPSPERHMTNQRIPTLSEVLLLVSSKTPVLVEIKNDKAPGLLENSVCDVLSRYDGPFAVQSFNPASLRIVKNLLPKVSRGQLSCACVDENMTLIERYALKNFWLNFISQPDFIGWNIKDLPSKKIAALKRKGYPILGWTVRNQEDLNVANRYCTNIIFENIRPKLPTAPSKT